MQLNPRPYIQYHSIEVETNAHFAQHQICPS